MFSKYFSHIIIYLFKNSQLSQITSKLMLIEIIEKNINVYESQPNFIIHQLIRILRILRKEIRKEKKKIPLKS